MGFRNFFGVFVSFVLVLAQIFINPNKVYASPCKDIEVVWVNGSGATINGTDNNYLDFRDAMTGVLSKTGLSFSFYELGSEDQGGYQYPAAGIGIESFKDFFTMTGAYFSAGEAYTYGQSVFTGVKELSAYLTKVSSSCAKTKFVIGGLSQGAGVVSESLPLLDAEKIIYVATFGDAKLYLPEGKGLFPDACRGKNLSPYRAYVPDCRAYQGILQGLRPYMPEKFTGKLGAWCNYHDTICSSYINFLNLSEGFDPHGSYGNSFNADRLYYDAADLIYEKILNEFNISTPEENKTIHNVAILLDSTGSMENLIASYKNEAIKLANLILNQGGKVALYEYRDQTNERFLPVLHCDFGTCTKDSFVREIESIEVDGGGDDDESVLPAIMTAFDDLKWETGAVKSTIVLTDAGFHQIESYRGNEIGVFDVVKKSLEIDPVNVYIITEPKIVNRYSELTERTSGKVFSTASSMELSTKFVMGRPDVKLQMDSFSGLVGEQFFFDASGTKSKAKVVRYDWDLDFDGVFETTTTLPTITAIYNSSSTGYVQVKATDENGMFGTMSAKVTVTERRSTTQPSISILESFEAENGVEISFSTDGFRTLVVLNNAPLGFTDSNLITISDLDFDIENKISLIPFTKDGGSGELASLTLEATGGRGGESNVNNDPENSDGDNNNNDELNNNNNADDDKNYMDRTEKNNTEGIFLPKAPDCGIVKFD